MKSLEARGVCASIRLQAMAMVLFMAVGTVASGQSKESPKAAAPAEKDKGSGGLSNLLDKVKDAVGIKSETNDVVRLFDGSNLGHFYTWLEGYGTFTDPHQVIGLQDGILRISGEKKGYLATRDQYSDYRLVLEFKWGKEAPGQKDASHNSGVFVHATGEDKAWMKSIECQIAEGLTGSVVVHGGGKITSGGETRSKPYSWFPRKTDKEIEFAHGKWNTMEILCEGNRVKVMVNGHVTFDGVGSNPNRGKIFLQSNGTEIFFRKIDLYPLNVPNLYNGEKK